MCYHLSSEPKYIAKPAYNEFANTCPLRQKISSSYQSFIIIFKRGKLVCRMLSKHRNPCQCIKTAFVKCSAKVIILQTKQMAEAERRPGRKEKEHFSGSILHVVSGSKTFKLNKCDFQACQYIPCWKANLNLRI
jgi:hypothetical protein